MKRGIIIALALLSFSGAAAAQDGSGNLVQALLGENGVLPGVMESAGEQSAAPLVDSLVGENGLIQGEAATPLNNMLTGALVEQDPAQVQAAAQNLAVMTGEALLGSVTGTEDPTALPDVLGGIIGFPADGSGAGMAGFGGMGMAAGGGQGMAPETLPLDNVDPGTYAALTNGVTLPGL